MRKFVRRFTCYGKIQAKFPRAMFSSKVSTFNGGRVGSGLRNKPRGVWIAQRRCFVTTVVPQHAGHQRLLRDSFNDRSEKEKEEKAVRQVTLLGLWSNVALSAGKGVAGVLGNSSALIADAVHSLSDTVSDIVTLWAVHASHKPRDESHPYGTGRYETLGTFVVSTLLIGAGVGIGLHSFDHILHAPSEVPSQIAIAMAGVSVVAKECLYHVTVRIGERARSNLLIANAWHHRSDSFSSIVALVGIGGAMIGVPILDPIAGMCVAALIAKLGLQTAMDSVVELADKTVDEEELSAVGQVIATVEGVFDYHQLRMRKMGTYSLVDTHINVDPWSSVSEAHEVAKGVMDAVKARFPHIEEVLVHVDPSPPVMGDGDELAAIGVPWAWRNLAGIDVELRERVIASLVSVDRVDGANSIRIHHVGKEESKRILVEADIAISHGDMTINDAKVVAKNAKETLMKDVQEIHSAQLSINLVKHQ